MTNAQIIPVVIGVLSSFIFSLLAFWFHRTLIPFFYDMFSTNYNATGIWTTSFSHSQNQGHVCEEEMEICHVLHKVSGVIFYTEKKPNGEVAQKKRFKFKGKFEDDVFSVIYWASNKHQKGRGTFTLESKNENLLEGKYSWYDFDTGKIESSDYKWTRVSHQKIYG